MTERTDEMLLSQFIDGDYQAFEALYQRYKGPLFRFVKRYRNDAQSDDIFQAIWEKIIMQASTFRGESSFKTYLFKTAHHKLIDHYRHMQVVESVVDQDNPLDSNAAIGHNSPELEHVKHAQQLAMRTCLEQLPSAQKEVFLLKQEAGFTAQQISEVVESGLEAIKSRSRAAIKNLKACIERKLSDGVVHGN